MAALWYEAVQVGQGRVGHSRPSSEQEATCIIRGFTRSDMAHIYPTGHRHQPHTQDSSRDTAAQACPREEHGSRASLLGRTRSGKGAAGAGWGEAASPVSWAFPARTASWVLGPPSVFHGPS